MFAPFAVLGEGYIGLCVLAVFAGLNAFVEKKKTVQVSDSFETWKTYRSEVLEEMK